MRHTITYTYCNPDGDRNSNAVVTATYTDFNANAYGNHYTYNDSHGNSYSNSNGNSQRNPDSNGYTKPNTNGYSDVNTHAQNDADAEACTNATAASHPGTAPVALL